MLDAVCYQHNVRSQERRQGTVDEDAVIANLTRLMFHAVMWDADSPPPGQLG